MLNLFVFMLYQLELELVCVCVHACIPICVSPTRVCVCRGQVSKCRTGPYMINFALLNLECNLILRLLAKKRIPSLLNLTRALKMV